MFGRARILILTFLLALVFVFTGNGPSLLSALYGINPAQAQQVKRVREKRRSLLEILFGRYRRQDGARNTRRSPASDRQSRPRPAPAKNIVPTVEKLENAKIVLVVGDFFASGLAKGLTRSFSQIPGVKIINKARGSSGLARLDYYNWPENISLLIEETNPAIVVVMIGTNDRQLIRQDGKKLKKRTEDWDAVYSNRVEDFGKIVANYKIPLIWIGLPPVRFKKMNRDFLFFNQIYRTRADKTGAQYIDVWDGFTDAEGNFVTSGPDVNGQIVRLRAKDGINITRAGQNKLAFYAEKSLRRLVGVGAFAPGLAVGVDGLPQNISPAYDPAKTGRTIQIGLNDPVLDGGEVLAGAAPRGISNADNLATVENSTSPPPVGATTAGRVDDFSWPLRKDAIRP